MNVKHKLAVAAVGLTIVGAVLFSRQAESDEHNTPPNELRTVVIRSECHRPMWISYGQSPPLQTIDVVTLNGNGSSAQSMLEGDRVWLLDDALEVLSGARVSAMTRRIVLDSSCRELTPYPS